MKKRALAILLVLVMVTAGLFATYSVSLPATKSATLKANIGEYLEHGFNDGATLYNSSIEVQNAFAATTPSFKYGYKTNATSGTFSFKMTVGDFVNQNTTGLVKIKLVSSSKGVVSHVAGTKVYELFNYTSTGIDKVDETTITIKPFLSFTAGDVDITGVAITSDQSVNGDGTDPGAPSGEYIATVGFEITAS